jgi:hypothetical protein
MHPHAKNNRTDANLLVIEKLCRTEVIVSAPMLLPSSVVYSRYLYNRLNRRIVIVVRCREEVKRAYGREGPFKLQITVD